MLQVSVYDNVINYNNYLGSDQPSFIVPVVVSFVSMAVMFIFCVVMTLCILLCRKQMRGNITHYFMYQLFTLEVELLPVVVNVQQANAEQMRGNITHYFYVSIFNIRSRTSKCTAAT